MLAQDSKKKVLDRNSTFILTKQHVLRFRILYIKPSIVYIFFINHFDTFLGLIFENITTIHLNIVLNLESWQLKPNIGGNSRNSNHQSSSVHSVAIIWKSFHHESHCEREEMLSIKCLLSLLKREAYLHFYLQHTSFTPQLVYYHKLLVQVHKMLSKNSVCRAKILCFFYVYFTW